MRGSKSYKVTFLIPLRDDDGEPFDLAYWTWWVDALARCVSDFADRGVGSGPWGNTMDQHRMIVVMVRSMREVDELRELLRRARMRFGLETMYLEYHEVLFEEVQ